MLKENFAFFREAINAFHFTGSIWPTSKWAAQQLVQPVLRADGPRVILELGPGTGPVTTKILDVMADNDELTICEINPRMMALLKERLSTHPRYERLRGRIRFMTCPAQELPEDRQYDVILCALPFLNFNLRTVKEIFSKIAKLSTENTVMTYYEYIGLRRLSLTVAPPERRQRMVQIDSFFKEFAERQEISRKPVWLNMPPIKVYSVRPVA